MKRSLTAILLTGVLATCGLVGCAEKSEVTTTEKVSTPNGTTTTTNTETVKSTGENPPPNTAGQTAETPK
jgi:hypothetical protein